MIHQEKPSSACKACDYKFEIEQSHLTKYPAGLSTDNPLGLVAIVSCPACGFGQTEPDPSQNKLDAYYASGEYWNEHKENVLLEAHQKVQAKVRLNTVREHLPVGRKIRVLDIGAGLGFLGDELHLNFGDVKYCAVEPDASSVARATERLKSKGLEFDFLNSLDQAGDDYDLVFLNHVLEHVHDPVGFLKLVKSRLSKTGILYVEVPNRDDRFKNNTFPHVLFFSDKSLRLTAERSDLVVKICEPFGASEKPEVSYFKKFYSRVRRAMLGRIFNHAADKNWVSVYEWADRHLYGYKPNLNGIWIRAVLLHPSAG